MAAQCQGAAGGDRWWFIAKCVRGSLFFAIYWSLSITANNGSLTLLLSAEAAGHNNEIITPSAANTRTRWVDRKIGTSLLNNIRGGADVLTPDDDSSQRKEVDEETITSSTTAFKRGTRTTGAGASKRHNPSIFSSEPSYYQQWTAAALAGDVLNRQSTKSSKTKVVMKHNNNPMSGRIWARQTDEGLIVKIPTTSCDEDGSNNAQKIIKLSASPYAWVDGNEDAEIITPTIQAEHVNIIEEAVDNNNDDDITSSSSLSVTSQFRPLEGVYGIFNLPCSGPHAVLITESEEVYTSPKANKSSCAIPLLQLRRIKSLEIVPLSRNRLQMPQNNETMMLRSNGDEEDESKQQRRINPTNLQLAEEARQLKLLRNSFKEHDFYFSVPNNEEGVVHDISHCLQRSFVEWMGRKSSQTRRSNERSNASHHRWWLPYVMEGSTTSPETKRRTVDPRFFWNEQSAFPLLQPLMGKTDEDTATQSPYGLLLDHVIPVTSAFVGIQRGIDIPSPNTSTSVKEKYDQLLISRRSKYRTGTRFTRRGVDGSGAVANYAETEQICLVLRGDGGDGDGDDSDHPSDLIEVYSHVQTRGSIPLHWSSPADVKAYRPRVYIGVDPVVQARGLRDHLLGELWWYSSSATKKSSGDEKTAARRRLLSSKVATTSDEDTKIAMVNLIDKHGDQGRLGNSFDAVLSAVMEVYCPDKVSDIGALKKRKESEPVIGSNAVKHIWYDFHAECKGGRWDRLSNLLDQVTPTLNGQGYFSVVPKPSDGAIDWEVTSVQDGAVRTNCMDCLDRTNVVQSMFGRYILYRQLQERKGLQVNKLGAKRITRRTLPLECIVGYRNQPLTLPWLQGEMAHRCLWADNADAISNLYAGTPALKGDFTRTGKRTKRGAMNDGVNSLQRYYLNNFIDADRQEGMDLLVGSTQFNFIPSEGDEESSRAFLLQELSNDRRGYDESHIRIKRKNNKGNDVLYKQGGNTRELELNWLPGDLRFHMKNEAQRSRSPPSLAAQEEHVDAESSSDFLLAVTSSAAAANTDALTNNGAIETLHNKLQSIDQRSSSARPWWAKTENKMIRSLLDARNGVGNIVAPALKGRRAFVTAVILLCKAPILSAALIASLIGSGFLDEDDSMECR
jgi:hypothetical protein